MPRIDLPQGPIHYGDTGGEGPVVVLVHGVMTNATVWDGVVAGLAAHARCLTPTLPLGAHREPMAPGTDLSPRGAAQLVDAFLAAMELTDAVVVGLDSGGAIVQLLVTEHPERVGRLVLLPCDAFENFFPPLFRPLQWAGHAPQLLAGIFHALRFRPLRRLPMAFGRFSKRGVDDRLIDGWLAPAQADRAILKEGAAFLRGVDSADTLRAAERLPAFDRPALVLWPREARTFPFAHAERLAALLPDCRLVEIQDSWEFTPLDQPAATAAAIAAFLEETAGVTAGEVAA